MAKLVGIDRAVGFSILSRGWSALSGVVTLVLLVRFLTGKQQGVYSSFGSFMALQVFFELGLGLVVLQFASHERAGLEWTPQGTLEGDANAKARLSSLLRLSLRWYGSVSALILAVILPLGLGFFHQYAPSGVAWHAGWVFVALGMAVSVMFLPLYAVLEGCGLVPEVAAAQFVANLLNTGVFWLMLTRHWGLLAAPIAGVFSGLWIIGWLSVRYRHFLRDLWDAARPGVVIHWRREMWPFQWRIALSYMSGYFIFQTFVPILLASHRPITAGQMGLTMSVTNAIAAIALAWVATKSAPFGRLVALRDWAQMDRLFFPCLWQSAGVLILGGGLFWSAALYLHHIHSPISARLLAPLPMGLLLLAAVVNHVVAAEAIYLRAHKQEPFLMISLLGGTLVALSSYVLGRLFGSVGMMIGYLSITLVIGLGLGTSIFIQKRRQWHQDLPTEPDAVLPPPTPVFGGR